MTDRTPNDARVWSDAEAVARIYARFKKGADLARDFEARFGVGFDTEVFFNYYLHGEVDFLLNRKKPPNDITAKTLIASGVTRFSLWLVTSWD